MIHLSFLLLLLQYCCLFIFHFYHFFFPFFLSFSLFCIFFEIFLEAIEAIEVIDVIEIIGFLFPLSFLSHLSHLSYLSPLYHLSLLSCVGEDLAVAEGHLELSVLAVEIVLQTAEVAAALPMAHGQVVEQAVAAGLGRGGRDLGLGEDPLQALDGQLTHVLDGVVSGHDDVHAREAAHGADVDHVVLGAGVAEPGGHQVLHAVHGRRGHGGFAVGLGDAEVEGGEALVDSRHIDARLQMGMVDGETLNYFHVRFKV